MGWRGELMNPKIFIRSDRKENAPGKLWEQQSGEGNARGTSVV
jgi:hypothetical protein